MLRHAKDMPLCLASIAHLEEKLQAFLVGDLNEAELDACADHIEACPACERDAKMLDAVADRVVVALRQGELSTGTWSAASAGSRIDVSPADGSLQRVGAYEILSELGRGGMGIVYLARHAVLHRIVALKMMSNLRAPGPDQRERFRREAEAVARLQHPNIVQLFEAGEHNGLPYFTLEYVVGGSLSSQLAGKPILPRQSWPRCWSRSAGPFTLPTNTASCIAI